MIRVIEYTSGQEVEVDPERVDYVIPFGSNGCVIYLQESEEWPDGLAIYAREGRDQLRDRVNQSKEVKHAQQSHSDRSPDAGS